MGETRRRLLGSMGLVLVAPALARAQGKVWRIGFLVGVSRPESPADFLYGDFLRGMREFGYEEGRHYLIEWSYAGGSVERGRAQAQELVQLGVDVIVTGNTPVTRAASSSTWAWRASSTSRSRSRSSCVPTG